MYCKCGLSNDGGTLLLRPQVPPKSEIKARKTSVTKVQEDEALDSQHPQSGRKRRRGPKQPNPLSMKPKKRVSSSSSAKEVVMLASEQNEGSVANVDSQQASHHQVRKRKRGRRNK